MVCELCRPVEECFSLPKRSLQESAPVHHGRYIRNRELVAKRCSAQLAGNAANDSDCRSRRTSLRQTQIRMAPPRTTDQPEALRYVWSEVWLPRLAIER